MNTGKDQNQHLKKNALISVFSLFFQSGYAALLGLAANLVLSIVLSPKTFGIYITVLAIISFLNYFSDIGLAASLIQKKEIDEEDKQTVFTVQQILIIFLIICGFMLTGAVKHFYKLEPSGIHLYWALLIGFYIASLKTIPSIVLEKKLKYQKIAFVQIVESSCFYLTVIVLALCKFDLNSFTIAVILRAIVGLCLMYYLSPWKIRLNISLAKLRRLLSFGVSFQATSLLALFKDDLMTLFLSKTLGFAAMGYIGWAKKWAEALIRIVMDNLTRVLFPLLSQIQDQKEKMGRVLEKLFYYQTLVLAPAIIGLCVIIGNFLVLIPKYGKWSPALPVFYLFSLSSLLLIFSQPFINLFNAIGKVKISFLFMIFWTAITWALVPLFIGWFGMIGYPMVHVIIGLTFILVLQTAKRHLTFSFLKSVAPGLVSAFLMGISIYWFNNILTTNWLNTMIVIITAVILYQISLFVFFKINFVKEIGNIFSKNE